MVAIAAHWRYISKNGRLPIEDDRGVVDQGREALKDIERQWRFGGDFIEDVGHRREAFNIMLSMSRGTDPLLVQRAAREFAKGELADHRYVMVLHDHQIRKTSAPQREQERALVRGGLSFTPRAHTPNLSESRQGPEIQR